MPRACDVTRVSLVEDHTLFAEALELALTLEGHVVQRVPIDAATPSLNGLLAAVQRSRPHVVLLDLDLGRDISGMGLIRPLTAAGVAVVVVTGSDDRVSWGESLSHGALTVLSKSAPLNTILATLREIDHGHRVLSREEHDQLVACFHENQLREHDSRTRLATLTPREHEILRQLTNGRQVRQIARDFVVSEATVRTQVKSILAKLGVSSQLAAVGVALRSHERRGTAAEAPPDMSAPDYDDEELEMTRHIGRVMGGASR